MVSSFETEMPTASGVFEPETAQPFMSPEIEEKIAETSVVSLIWLIKKTGQLISKNSHLQAEGRGFDAPQCRLLVVSFRKARHGNFQEM